VDRIVIEVPAAFKNLAAAMCELVAVTQKAVDRDSSGGAVAYAEIELELASATAAAERAAHGAVLRSLDVDAPHVIIGGARHTRVGRHEQSYYTMAGPVVIERPIYRRDGERNGKVVDAISLRVGAVADGWLPQTARAMAHQVQRGTPREAETGAAEIGRLPYSRSSFDRVAHAVGKLYVQRDQEIGAALIEAYEPPSELQSISVGLDRVALPMAEPRPRPVGRPRRGAPKNPITVAWRMAWVGTVTLHDGKGKALHTIRYGGMPDDGATGLLQAMADEVRQLLARRADLKVTLLSDGAHDVVNQLATEVGERLDRTPTQLIDFWHLIEKLAPAATLLGDGDRLTRWRLSLLNDPDAAAFLLAELRASGCEAVANGDKKPVHEAITYLENHRPRMNYAAARAAGLPIGSGNTEATCKTLVSIRMRRAGARWKVDTGRHVLKLRALALSDRWAAGIDRTLRPLCREVRAAA
jgi:hypothetical protein